MSGFLRRYSRHIGILLIGLRACLRLFNFSSLCWLRPEKRRDRNVRSDLWRCAPLYEKRASQDSGVGVDRSGVGEPGVSCLSRSKAEKTTPSILSRRNFIRRSNCFRSSKFVDSFRRFTIASNCCANQWNRSECLDINFRY